MYIEDFHWNIFIGAERNNLSVNSRELGKFINTVPNNHAREYYAII